MSTASQLALQPDIKWSLSTMRQNTLETILQCYW